MTFSFKYDELSSCPDFADEVGKQYSIYESYI